MVSILNKFVNFVTRKRRCEDEPELPTYEFKVPKTRENQMANQPPTATSTPMVKLPKSMYPDLSQLRSGHSVTVFSKKAKTRKENVGGDANDVIVLPGPSGLSSTSGAFRFLRQPLQSVQQEEVLVVKEMESPTTHSLRQIRDKRANTFMPSWVNKKICHPKRRFQFETTNPILMAPKQKLCLPNKMPGGSIAKRTPSSRKSCLQECYRIEDKRKYSNLLKNYLLASTSSLTTARNMLDSPNLSTSRFGSTFMSPKRTIRESIELVDLTLTEDVIEKSTPKLEVSSTAAGTPHARSLSVEEEEVVVLEGETIIFRKNSLAEVLKTKEAFDECWIPKVTAHYSEKRLQREKELQKEQERDKITSEKAKVDFDDKHLERLSKQIHLFDISKEEEEEEEEEEIEEILPPLSDEAENMVNRALMPKPPQEILVSGYNKEITRRDIATLSGLNWLNDEVINFYMDLLMERGKLENYPSVYTMNTFFYPKLRSVGHSALKRWTKKVDIFSYEMIVVPVHLGMHWCMALIDLKNKTVSYYDSMGGNDQGCGQALLKYLQDESQDKKKQSYDTSDWQCIVAKDIPHQMNGSDCGMFSCMFAETLTRRARINFAQEHMPYFRRRMVYELLTKKIMT